MTWLVSKLNRRIAFMEQVQTPNAGGGFTQTYKQVGKNAWAGLEPVSTSAASYIRNVQVGEAPTHKFIVRRNRLAGVDTYGDGVVKADNYVFLLSGATPTMGRLFRILTAANTGEADESLEFLAKEMGQLDTQRGVVK